MQQNVIFGQARTVAIFSLNLSSHGIDLLLLPIFSTLLTMFFLNPENEGKTEGEVLAIMTISEMPLKQIKTSFIAAVKVST